MIYRPGQIVPTSGIYNAVNRSGVNQGRRVTCVEGEPFPPTKRVGEYGYKLAIRTN